MTPDPYAALLALAERESTVVAHGRFEELEAVAAARSEIVAGLPAQAPASARPALERTLGLQLATTAALQASLAETRRQMGALGQGSRAARAYAAAA